MTTTGINLAASETVSAQNPLSADAALQELMAGNKRFVDGTSTAHQYDLTILKQHTVEKQEPFAAVLSCADSRVPVELVFDQTIGRRRVLDFPLQPSELHRKNRSAPRHGEW